MFPSLRLLNSNRCYFRTALDMKPLTQHSCQPSALTNSAIIAPLLRYSNLRIFSPLFGAADFCALDLFLHLGGLLPGGHN